MIDVSDAWKKKQTEILAPEGFVEISYRLADTSLQPEAVASSTVEADFATTADITDENATVTKYITNELNLWVLDGSCEVLPDSTVENAGYVSDAFGTGSVTISLDKTHEELLPSVTIVWSDTYGEYATDFTVTVKRDNFVVSEVVVTGNKSFRNRVKTVARNYNSVVITIQGWSLPNRRPRIESVYLDNMVVFGKDDILAFTHTQTVCLNSGTLPKNSVSFSLDNSTGNWDLNNPDGVERYMSDRQKMSVRYGIDVDGETEWIDAGTFYLTDWNTPANGMEAKFEARDLLEYMIDTTYTGIKSGTLYAIAAAAVAQANLPQGAVVEIDEALKNYTADFSDDNAEKSAADILQMCANAACCVMYQDRAGVLRIERKSCPQSSYTISREYEYEWPEFTLSKPLAGVAVTGGSDAAAYTLEVEEAGEIQTVDNKLIGTAGQAAEVAEWVASNLETRKTVSGKWRADPRFDVLDAVTLESKLGTVLSVWLQEVTYTFNGAFSGTFKGYIPRLGNMIEYYSGEIFSGEVS